MRKYFSGCMGFILLVLLVALAIALAVNQTLDSAGEYERAKGDAESQVITAHGLASLNRAEAALLRSEATLLRAEAFVVRMHSILPYTVLGVMGLFGLSLLALALAVIVRQPASRPVVERQIVFLPGPNTPRRDVWQLMDKGTEIIAIPREKIEHG